MHVALVNRWYPPHSGFGGVAMYNYFLAAALAELGHRVTVVAARWSTDAPALERSDGIQVRRLLIQHRPWLHRLPLAGRYMRSIVMASYSVQVMRALEELDATDPPDVVEFADIEAEGYAYLQRRRRATAIVRCHTPMFVLHRYYRPEERPWSTKSLGAREKFCIRRADALSAPSHDMANTIARECRLPEQRIAVIPNALDTAIFDRAIADRRARDADELVFLHVGRMDRGKGIDVLAQAIPWVLKEVPRARFVFIGDDCPDGHGSTWRARLEMQSASLGLRDRIDCLGPLDQAETIAWYGRSDVALVPSLIYESFSYTCAQASAASLPVVASRIGGIPETVEDGVSGVIVEPGSVEQLTAAMIRLARDPALRQRMGIAGKEKAKQFASARVAERTLALYQRAKKGRQAA